MYMRCRCKRDHLKECRVIVEADTIAIHETFLAIVKSNELTQAMENLDIKLARKLMFDEGVKPLRIDAKPFMAFLKLAVQSRDAPFVKELLKQKPNLHTPEADEIMKIAMDDRDTQIASMLVHAGVRLEPKYVNSLAFSWGAEKPELALLMLDHGVDIRECENLLEKAVRRNEFHFAQELLKRGAAADFEEEIEIRNNIHQRVWDAYCKAVGFGQISRAIELLTTCDLDATKPSHTGVYPVYVAMGTMGSTVAEHLIEKGANVHQPNDDEIGQYPIHNACKISSYQNIKLLLSLGVDVTVVDKLGQSPFSLLSNRSLHEPQKLFIKYLAIQIVKNGNRNAKNLTSDLAKKTIEQQHFFQDCTAEIQQMKELRVLDYYSFFRIFNMNVKYLSFRLRDPKFLDSFRNECLCLNIFAIDIDEKLENAIDRKNSLVAIEEALCDAIGELIPDLIMEKIIYYLYLLNEKNESDKCENRRFSYAKWKRMKM